MKTILHFRKYFLQMWITCFIVSKIFLILSWRRWTNYFRHSWGYDPRNSVMSWQFIRNTWRNFRRHRLIISAVAITATTKNNPLNLPTTFDPGDEKACIRKIWEKKEEKFAKAAYSSFPYRDFIVEECFQYEVTEFPSSFTEGKKTYRSKNQIY